MEGWDLAHWAAWRGYDDVMMMMMTMTRVGGKGEDEACRPGPGGVTPLMLAAKVGR